MNTTFNTQNLSFQGILKYLDTLGMFHMKAGQDRMKKALKNLELLPLPYTSVQIVGTNGKGSTSSFLASLAKEHNLKTGLYTSPHFLSPKERILYNGEEIPDEIWIKCAQKTYLAHSDLSYFEFLTVLAALIFKELKLDIVFFEAGLGGTFDATTALQADITVFTPISLDHCDILGENIKEIAHDKAQALNIWSKCAITACQEQDALHEIEEITKKYSIPLYTSSNYFETQEGRILKDKIGLKGIHQEINASLALRVWQILCTRTDLKSSFVQNSLYIQKALENTFIAGRLQYIPAQNSPFKNINLVLDGGHNVHGLNSVKNFFSAQKPDYIVFSFLKDKDIKAMLQIIAEIATNHLDHSQGISKIFIPEIQNNPRSSQSKDLANQLQDYFSSSFALNSCPISPYKNLDECLKAIHNEEENTQKEEKTLLICGSLYLLAEFYSLYPHYLLPNKEFL